MHVNFQIYDTLSYEQDQMIYASIYTLIANVEHSIHGALYQMLGVG